jgi:hypothetical protein
MVMLGCNGTNHDKWTSLSRSVERPTFVAKIKQKANQRDLQGFPELLGDKVWSKLVEMLKSVLGE